MRHTRRLAVAALALAPIVFPALVASVARPVSAQSRPAAAAATAPISPRSTAASPGAPSAPKATASPPPPASRATRSPTTSASASGGIWKTTDGGTNWTPLFDDQPVQSIGSLAVARVRSERRLGRHRRGEDPLAHLARAGRLQVDGRGQDVGAHGAREDRAHSAHRHPSTGSQHGPRLRARSRLRSAAGARRLPHDRRRHDVDEGPLRRREHRLLRPRDGSEEPARAVRRDVAARDQDMGTHERRAGRRTLRLARRRRDVDSA